MKKTKKYLFVILSGSLAMLLMWTINLFEKPSQYDYLLSNHSDNELIIKFTESNKQQELFQVETGVTICLSSHNFISYRESKIINWFKEVQIYTKSDTAIFDYLNEGKWKYEVIDKVGRYKLEITNDDFTK